MRDREVHLRFCLSTDLDGKAFIFLFIVQPERGLLHFPSSLRILYTCSSWLSAPFWFTYQVLDLFQVLYFRASLVRWWSRPGPNKFCLFQFQYIQLERHRQAVSTFMYLCGLEAVTDSLDKRDPIEKACWDYNCHFISSVWRTRSLCPSPIHITLLPTI